MSYAKVAQLESDTEKAFPKEKVWKSSSLLELIHSDVCGPMQTANHAGNGYFLIFIDDCTKMVRLYSLRQKLEVFTVFKKFKMMMEKQSDFQIKKLSSDRGGEYMSLVTSVMIWDLKGNSERHILLNKTVSQGHASCIVDSKFCF